MGLGSPVDLLEAVHRGVDLFDSVLPARVARNGQLWVPGGRLNLRNEQFLDDPAPVQDDCPCLLCTRFSRAYLGHLFRARELLAYRLATCHNLTFTLDFMVRIRSAMRAGTFPVDMPELRRRAVRMSGGEARRKVRVKSCQYRQRTWRRAMGSRDRPAKEAKKKPKDKLAQPRLSPLSEAPQQVELIRKPRKPRRETTTDEG